LFAQRCQGGLKAIAALELPLASGGDSLPSLFGVRSLSGQRTWLVEAERAALMAEILELIYVQQMPVDLNIKKTQQNLRILKNTEETHENPEKWGF